MRYRYASIAFLAGAAMLSPTHAEDFAVSTTVGFESRYMFRGIQFAETSFQPAINLSYGGLYGGAWLNLPVGDDDFIATPGGEELDLFIGYGSEIAAGVTLDIGLTYYTFPDLMSGFFDLYKEDEIGQPGANTLEPYIGIAFDTPLSPSIYLYRDFMFDTFTVQGSASHSFPLGGAFSFDVGGTIGWVEDDDPNMDYFYGHANGDLTYAFSDTASFYVGVRYGGSDIPGGSVIDDSILGTMQKSGVWWGVGFTSSF